MKLKVLAAAAVLSLGAASSFAVDTPIALTGTNTGVGGNVVTRTVGSFNDNFTFTTGALASNFSGAVSTISLGALGDVTFSNVTLRNFTTNAVVATFTGSAGAAESYTLLSSPALLANTAYAVHVEGAVTGSVGAYAVVANVAAVPEPETYALMLAGLACVGFVARRRNAG